MRFSILFLALIVIPADASERLIAVPGGENLTAPFAVDFGEDGTLYVCEMTGNKIVAISPEGKAETIAGTGEKGNAGNGKKGKEASFNGPHHLLIGPTGSVLIADTWNQQVRQLDPKTGLLEALAGTGKKGDAQAPVEALNAEIGGVYCLALFGKSKLYVMDLDNRKVRLVDLEKRTISTVAGNGEKGIPKDGSSAKDSPLVDPRAITVDSEGQLYILERGGHSLRVVDLEGKIYTVAGTGKAGFSGDDGPALEATMNGPKHLSMDLDGSVLIADTENHVIRRYDPKTRRMTRVAGTGKKGDKGLGGNPLEAELAQPHGVIVHPKTGDLYISDSSNNRIVKIIRE